MRFDPTTHTVHAAGRTWPADPASTSIRDLDAGSFVHHDRRCVVRFESGWSASIVWGSSTYSSNHDVVFAGTPFTEEPNTVEVGVIDHTGELRMRDGDGPEAYLDDDQLAALLDDLATMPSDHNYGERPPTVDDLMNAAREAGIDIPEPQAMTEAGDAP